MPEGMEYPIKPKMTKTVKITTETRDLPKLKKVEIPDRKPLKKIKLKPKKKKAESHVEKKKRKESGSVARKKKRAAISKKVGDMGIFKELQKEQRTRSGQ
ncbi:unnamed protein product [marine sediment metagenome]|uniref:Uncharacterized protein n=1 Tax=marine sediment metagenome TaxID=412755 RepID=X0WRW1_9ZZZZ